jgi:hypothetical protein
MKSSTLSLARQRAIVADWKNTGRLLEAQRYAELAAQSKAQSQQAAFDMLQLGGMLASDPLHERDCGMIEMQRLFSRWHDRRHA